MLPHAVAEALVAIVGDEHVVLDLAELTAAERATFATTQRITAIVRPANVDETRACMRVATEHGALVYPISRGKNWGLGSRVPPRNGAFLLDLGRMNRIVDFDETLAYVTVEPGVTFLDLYEFLKARRSRLFANTTGSSPHASVLGNALERGDGTGPYGDRFAHVCGMEVVLATGECFHTGFDRFDKTRLGPLHRWGVGPSLDGLFSQSNLGVVTRMTLWLSPLPRSVSVARFNLRDPRRLADLIDACRTLRLEGTLRSVVGIWNDMRVLSTSGAYPWELTGGRTPLGRDDVDAIKHTWGGATWFGTTAIYAATEAIGRAHRERVEEVLCGACDDLVFLHAEGDPRSGEELLQEDYGATLFTQGIPHEKSLRSVYFRKKMPLPDDLDPDRDGCGVLWVCPALPFAGSDVAKAVAILEDVIPKYDLEPLIAMVAQSERVMYLVPLLIYDRDVKGADEAAKACHDALLAKLGEAGYLPYRLGIQSMESAPPARDDHGALLERLKRALDPADVLAPGRYDFRATWPQEE